MGLLVLWERCDHRRVLDRRVLAQHVDEPDRHAEHEEHERDDAGEGADLDEALGRGRHVRVLRDHHLADHAQAEGDEEDDGGGQEDPEAFLLARGPIDCVVLGHRGEGRELLHGDAHRDVEEDRGRGDERADEAGETRPSFLLRVGFVERKIHEQRDEEHDRRGETRGIGCQQEKLHGDRNEDEASDDADEGQDARDDREPDAVVFHGRRGIVDESRIRTSRSTARGTP